MTKFWTITSADTTHTNDRSERFTSKEAAIKSAKTRITGNRVTAVYILEAVAIVQATNPPIEVVDI